MLEECGMALIPVLRTDRHGIPLHKPIGGRAAMFLVLNFLVILVPLATAQTVQCPPASTGTACECTGSNPCSNNGVCSATDQSSFTCDCTGTGFEGAVCDEASTNPCINGMNNCVENAACVLINPLFNIFVCVCEIGFEGVGTVQCANVNECDDTPCDDNAFCSDTVGSFTCACQPGYEGDGFDCLEINECAIGTHDCLPQAACVNTDGSFICDCGLGFLGNGVDQCVDINECDQDPFPCDDNAFCTNTFGSFQCRCQDGFRGDGFTFCDEINECVEGLDNCGQDQGRGLCLNVEGSFACVCFTGFVAAMGGTACLDLNECLRTPFPCDDNAFCTNNVGSFSCRCQPGYRGDGFNCQQIDECAENLDNCDANAACIDTDGSFICSCNPPLIGDGRTCSAGSQSDNDGSVSDGGDGSVSNS
eukprot:scpid61463/ scgid1264/ Fibrillin-1